MAALLRLLTFLALAWFLLTAFNHCFSTPVSPENVDLGQIPRVTLSQARDDASLYNNPVWVNGVVIHDLYFGFINAGWYILDDGTARMLILKRGVPPATGRKVSLVIIPKPIFRTNGQEIVTATEVMQVEIQKPAIDRLIDWMKSLGGQRSSCLSPQNNGELFLSSLTTVGPVAHLSRLNVTDGRENNTKAHRKAAATPVPYLFILINDISSSSRHLEITPDQIRRLFDQFGSRGGVQLSGILIQSNSSRQQPAITSFLRLDTVKIIGRYITAQQGREKNKQLRADFNKRIQAETRAFSQKVLLPRNQVYTDVQGALRLAKITAEQPNYGGYKVRILLLSDLIHDLPGQKPTLQPVIFPSNVEVYTIGNAPGIDVKKTFPKNKVVQIASFESIFYVL